MTITFGCMKGGKLYVLSKEDSLYKESLKTPGGVIMVPPKAKYARNTFLIDSNSYVYFYSFQEQAKSTGVNDDREPDTIGLMPNHLFKIPMGMERAFFEENVLKHESYRKAGSIMVALFKDSTRNEFLQYLLKLKKRNPDNFPLQIRMALPEERTVLKYKIRGEALAVLKKRPKCSPGLVDKRRVNTNTRIPIRFFISCKSNSNSKHHIGRNSWLNYIYENVKIKKEFKKLYLNFEQGMVFKVIISRRECFVRVTIYQIKNSNLILEDIPAIIEEDNKNLFLLYDGSEIFENRLSKEKFVESLSKFNLSNKDTFFDPKILQFDVSLKKEITFNYPPIDPFDILTIDTVSEKFPMIK